MLVKYHVDSLTAQPLTPECASAVSSEVAAPAVNLYGMPPGYRINSCQTIQCAVPASVRPSVLVSLSRRIRAFARLCPCPPKLDQTD